MFSFIHSFIHSSQECAVECWPPRPLRYPAMGKKISKMGTTCQTQENAEFSAVTSLLGCTNNKFFIF